MMFRSWIAVTIIVVVALATAEAAQGTNKESDHRFHTHLELFLNGSLDKERLWNEFKTVYGKD